MRLGIGRDLSHIHSVSALMQIGTGGELPDAGVEILVRSHRGSWRGRTLRAETHVPAGRGTVVDGIKIGRRRSLWQSRLIFRARRKASRGITGSRLQGRSLQRQSGRRKRGINRRALAKRQRDSKKHYEKEN